MSELKILLDFSFIFLFYFSVFIILAVILQVKLKEESNSVIIFFRKIFIGIFLLSCFVYLVYFGVAYA